MKNELKNRYESLYGYMASSRNPEYMKAFGSVMNEMMDWMVDNKADAASEWIDKLSAIKWRNYLTPHEAEDIVSVMSPKAPWSRDVWRQAMEALGLEMEREPVFNTCALWVTMNMIYSDSAKTIANIMGGDLDSIDANELVKAIHALALDKLTDEDGMFNVRHYFGLL